MRAARFGTLLAISSYYAWSGCVVDEVDYTGLLCEPEVGCPGGWVCEPASQHESICVREGGEGPRPDGGADGPSVPECDHGATRACTVAGNACNSGSETCEKGAWGDCEPIELSEICGDNQDNDCDHSIDEGCPCSEADSALCGIDVGACEQGQQTCESGVWSICSGGINPTAELCNGLDDDCDGTTDENAWSPIDVFAGADASVGAAIRAIAAGEELHLAFTASSDLLTSRRLVGDDSEGWIDAVEILDSAATAEHISMAAGTQGSLHLALLTNTLEYWALNPVGGWQQESDKVCDNCGGSAVVVRPAIAANNDNEAHIAFYDDDGEITVVAEPDDANDDWIESFGGLAEADGYPSLAFDGVGAGTRHLAYFQSGGALGYTRGSSGFLVHNPSVGQAGRHASLALDDKAIVHISYQATLDGDAPELWYAVGNDDSFAIEPLITGSSSISATSIAVPPSGEVQISFEMDGDLIFAQLDPTLGQWSIETVEPGGVSAVLLLDSLGGTHIVHTAPGAGNSSSIRYARRCTPPP